MHTARSAPMLRSVGASNVLLCILYTDYKEIAHTKPPEPGCLGVTGSRGLDPLNYNEAPEAANLK